MKRITALVLVFVLMFSTLAYAEPQQPDARKEAAELMVKLGLLKGYENGELGLEKKITRAEFSTIIIRMTGYDSKPFTPSKNITFKDLTQKHWAYSPVMMCASLGYINGYTDKTFKPSNSITYAEAIAIMVRVLGYNDQVKGKWPNNYLDKANELGILKNLEVSASKAITRGEISILVVNSLPVQIK